MPPKRMTWSEQLGRCYVKGYRAREAGEPANANPYRTGYDGNGASQGGNVQRQRQNNWARGWDRADRGLPIDDSNG